MTSVLFVCSSGGHLDQLMHLLPPPQGYTVSIATFDKPDSRAKISDYEMHPLVWPTNRSVTALLRNGIIALRVLRRTRPEVVVSSGAAAAVPFFYLAKIFCRSKTVFIECIDRPNLPTLTARMVKPATDVYVCQWDEQLQNFPRSRKVSVSR